MRRMFEIGSRLLWIPDRGEMNIFIKESQLQRSRVKAKLILLVAAVLLAACGTGSRVSSSAPSSVPSATPTTGGKKASGTPYVIHAILSETGPAAFLGSREAKLLQALASNMNASGGIDGHPIKMDIQDNQSNPATAVSMANKLISSGVSAILNGSYVGVGNAVDALAGPNGPVIYDLSPGVYAKPGSMIFTAATSTELDAQAYLTYLKSKGLTNIASITSSDASGVDGYNQLQKALAEPKFSSMHLLAHQTFDPTAVSVATQLSVIKATHPQALVVWTTGTPFGVVLNGMSSLGMENIPTLTTEGNDSFGELTHFAKELPKTLYFTSAPLYLPPSTITNKGIRTQVMAFNAAVTSVGGHPGDAWALAWDPAQLLISAIKKLGVNATAKQIQKYMENLHNAPGIYGSYNMSVNDHRGLNISDIYMMQWTGKSFVIRSGPGGIPMNS